MHTGRNGSYGSGSESQSKNDSVSEIPNMEEILNNIKLYKKIINNELLMPSLVNQGELKKKLAELTEFEFKIEMDLDEVSSLESFSKYEKESHNKESKATKLETIKQFTKIKNEILKFIKIELNSRFNYLSACLLKLKWDAQLSESNEMKIKLNKLIDNVEKVKKLLKNDKDIDYGEYSNEYKKHCTSYYNFVKHNAVSHRLSEIDNILESFFLLKERIQSLSSNYDLGNQNHNIKDLTKNLDDLCKGSFMKFSKMCDDIENLDCSVKNFNAVLNQINLSLESLKSNVLSYKLNDDQIYNIEFSFKELLKKSETLCIRFSGKIYDTQIGNISRVSKK